MGRRKQRSPRKSALIDERASAKERPATVADRPLPPTNPPRRNLTLLIFSIALFLVWLAALVVLAMYR